MTQILSGSLYEKLIEEGMEKGIQQGMQQGMQFGQVIRSLLAELELFSNMIAQSVSTELMQKLSGLSMEVVVAFADSCSADKMEMLKQTIEEASAATDIATARLQLTQAFVTFGWSEAQVETYWPQRVDW